MFLYTLRYALFSPKILFVLIFNAVFSREKIIFGLFTFCITIIFVTLMCTLSSFHKDTGFFFRKTLQINQLLTMADRKRSNSKKSIFNCILIFRNVLFLYESLRFFFSVSDNDEELLRRSARRPKPIKNVDLDYDYDYDIIVNLNYFIFD